MKLPSLYHKGKTGSIVKKDIRTEGADIVTVWGQMGTSNPQTARKTVVQKNVGKANETSLEQQAILEAKAMWQHEVDRKYSETIEGAKEIVFLPMLAQNYRDNYKKSLKRKKRKGDTGIVFPADAQPKLDGVRCMAYWEGDQIYLGTRSGQEWTVLDHIKEELEKILPKEMVLDGEFYVHDVEFELLMSWCKKFYPETLTLEFHLFDMPFDENGENLPWKQRKENVKAFFNEVQKNNPNTKLRLVPCIEVKNHQDLMDYDEVCMEEGYEGCMVRNRHEVYMLEHKTTRLQKVKSSTDDEYEIIGFTDGIGREKGCVIWKCKTTAGKEFDVRPKGKLPRRAELFKEGHLHIGEMLKVRYQNYTKAGAPRFPRGLGFRDEKDMSPRKKK